MAKSALLFVDGGALRVLRSSGAGDARNKKNDAAGNPDAQPMPGYESHRFPLRKSWQDTIPNRIEILNFKFENLRFQGS
jgi:hypothetical protein